MSGKLGLNLNEHNNKPLHLTRAANFLITGAPINSAHLNRMPYSRNLLQTKL